MYYKLIFFILKDWTKKSTKPIEFFKFFILLEICNNFLSLKNFIISFYSAD